MSRVVKKTHRAGKVFLYLFLLMPLAYVVSILPQFFAHTKHVEKNFSVSTAYAEHPACGDMVCGDGCGCDGSDSGSDCDAY